MNLSQRFIEKPVMTTLVMAALVIFGGYGYATLPVSDLPNIDFPTISVFASLPGAGPVLAPASPVAQPPQRLRPPGLLELEELLSGHLDTRVNIEMGSKKGKMTVEFATLEDLERIYRVMVGEPSTSA